MQIGHALQEAGLNGYDIEIMFQNGRCVLQGVVGTPQQRAGGCSNCAIGARCSVGQQSAPAARPGSPDCPEFALRRWLATRLPRVAPCGTGSGGLRACRRSLVPISRCRAECRRWEPRFRPPAPGPQSSGPAYDNPNLPQVCLALVCPVSQLRRCDLSESVQCQCLALHRTVLPLSASAAELAESDSGMVGRPLGPQLRLADGSLVVVPEPEELVGRFAGPTGKIGKSVKVCVL